MILWAWQDAVFTIGSLALALALLPTLLGPHKPSRWTAALTALVLVTYGIALASLDQRVGAWTTFMLSLLWCIIGWQAVGRQR